MEWKFSFIGSLFQVFDDPNHNWDQQGATGPADPHLDRKIRIKNAYMKKRFIFGLHLFGMEQRELQFYTID